MYLVNFELSTNSICQLYMRRVDGLLFLFIFITYYIRALVAVLRTILVTVSSCESTTFTVMAGPVSRQYHGLSVRDSTTIFHESGEFIGRRAEN